MVDVLLAVVVLVDVELVTVGEGLITVRGAQIMEGLAQVRVPLKPEGVTAVPSVVHVAEPMRILVEENILTV